jgi:aminopeptidase N
MDWFFEQFFFKPGHPVFEVSKQWDDRSKTLTLEVLQTQDTAHGVPQAYRIPVVIGFYTAGGKNARKIWLEKRSEVFELSLDEQPSLVKFDDNNVLLKELVYEQPLDEMLYKLKNDDVVGRAEAARKLGKKNAGDRVMAELADAAAGDEFWYVRQAALEGLAAAGYGDIAALAKSLALDPDSQVRTSAIRILGDTGDNGLVGFFKKRFELEDSYRVQAECIDSIGKCGTPNDAEYVKKAGAVTSTRNVITQAAVRAIKILTEGRVPSIR